MISLEDVREFIAALEEAGELVRFYSDFRINLV